MIKSKIIVICMAIALQACHFRSGKADGSYFAANLGIREEGVLQSSNFYAANANSGFESFQNLTSLGKTLAYVDALKSVTRSLSSAYSSVTNTKTSAGVENAKTAAGVKEAQINADLIKSTTPAQ